MSLLRIMGAMPFARWYFLENPIDVLTGDQREALNVFKMKLAGGEYRFESVACLCGKSGGSLVARRDRYALPVDALLCRRCGILRQSPRMTEAGLAAFYARDYRPIYVGTAQASETFFASQVRQGERIFEFVKSAFDGVSRPVVFDVGCGSGGALIPFLKAGWQGFGCDVGGDYLRQGRDKGLVLEEGEVDALAKHGKADLVILSHVLEHLPHPAKSLGNIAQVLTNRGFVHVELPGIFHLHRTYGDFLLFLQNAHLYHFTLKTLSAMMADCGFNCVKGDEVIRALFRRTERAPAQPPSDQYWKVLRYLAFTECHRFCRQFAFLRRLRHCLRNTTCTGDATAGIVNQNGVS